MKNILLFGITSVILCLFPVHLYSQIITLGSANNFALFTSIGAITNTGKSQVTGHVGSNIGGSTTFGNVNGNMHDQDTASALCGVSLLAAYGQLNSAAPTALLASPFGNGDTLVPGVYRLAAASAMNQTLYLNAQGNPGAVFIIQVQGPLATGANSKVKLLNGALACNVYWKVEGPVTLNSGTSIKGTIVANNGAIHVLYGDTIEGRALSLNGSIDIDVAMISTPVGCGSPILLGPTLPNIGGLLCYTLFSSIGPLVNNGTTYIKGDIGSNVGSTTGFDSLLVNGTIHKNPDPSTSQAASDLTAGYNQINAMVEDILLVYPAQFGQNLVLTPHTYLMNGATALTDTLFLNAMGRPEATFVIKCYGAFSALPKSRVMLINGTQAKNVYWMVNGAVSILDSAIFNGTIICAGGNMDITTGAVVNGRALTTTGALNTSSVRASMPSGCGSTVITPPINDTVCLGDTAMFIVNATGAGLTYRWRKGNVDLINGVRIQGVSNDTLIIFPTLNSDSASNYNVVISSSTGSYTTDSVSLKINTPTVITTEPTNQTGCLTSSVRFVVKATGGNLTYQWRKGNVNITNDLRINGAQSDTLTINIFLITDTASNYNVIVSGACGANDTSNFVRLSTNTSSLITVEPTSQSGCIGTSVSFSVTAAGTGLTYQWRRGNVLLVNNLTTSGVYTSVLTINPTTLLDISSVYNVIVSGTCAPNDTSVMVSYSQSASQLITVEPTDQSACPGNPVSFSVTAVGSGLTYRWRKGNVFLINGPNMSGVSTSVLTINPTTPLDISSVYNVIVSGTCAPNDTSIMVSFIQNTPPVITTEPVGKIACAGDSVTLSITASGSALTYRWRKGNVDLTNTGNISGVFTDVLHINPVALSDASSTYNVIVSGTCAPNDTSLFASVIVKEIPVVTATSNTPVCVDDTLKLMSTFIAGGTYNWTGPNGFGSPLQNVTIAHATTSYDGIYNLIVTANGCSSPPASTTIEVKECIKNEFFTPEGFSPNGDGYNDVFVIRGISQFPNNSINIYNRWGVKVYTASPYTSTWDGTTTMGVSVGGSALPVGTYFYTLDLGDGSKVKQGSIYLTK